MFGAPFSIRPQWSISPARPVVELATSSSRHKGIRRIGRPLLWH